MSRPKPRGLRRYLVLATVVGLIGTITAFTVGRRRGGETTQAVAPSPPSAAQPAVTTKKLFSVSFRTGLTMSPDGTRMALNSDRLQVREIGGTQLWSTVLPTAGDEVTHVEFDGDELRFSVRLSEAIYRWNYAGDGSTRVEVPSVGGLWCGRSALGEVVYSYGTKELFVIDDGGRKVRSWTLEVHADGVTASPDRKQIAYLEAGRFTGRLVVRDLITDALIRTDDLVSPTALTWLDDQTLLYAIGTLEQPRIMRISTAGGAFGTASELYGLDTGWFGPMSVRGNRMFVLQMQPSPRARLLDRLETGTSSRDLDHASVSLGWVAAGHYLSWSRNSHRVEQRDGVTLELTKAVLDGEPANATNAGDVLIAAMRRPAGREAIAVSRSTGALLWRHQDGLTLAARCADDLRPPCFAIRVTPTEDQVVTLDPTTGELGTTPVFRGKAEDIAVSSDGLRIAVVGLGEKITEIDPKGTVLAIKTTEMSTLRSVAYDPRGGIFVGGTKRRNNFVVGHLHDGAWTVIAQSDDDILSFVRPSPDGSQILVLARVYAPEVWQIQLAQP